MFPIACQKVSIFCLNCSCNTPWPISKVINELQYSATCMYSHFLFQLLVFKAISISKYLTKSARESRHIHNNGFANKNEFQIIIYKSLNTRGRCLSNGTNQGINPPKTMLNPDLVTPAPTAVLVWVYLSF